MPRKLIKKAATGLRRNSPFIAAGLAGGAAAYGISRSRFKKSAKKVYQKSYRTGRRDKKRGMVVY